MIWIWLKMALMWSDHTRGAMWRLYINGELVGFGVEPVRGEAFGKADHQLKIRLNEPMYPGGPKAE